MDWLKENKSKGINDYYAIYGNEEAPANSAQKSFVEYQQTNHATLKHSTTLRIGLFKLFFYTGFIMFSIIVWSITFFIVFFIIWTWLFDGFSFNDWILSLLGL